MKNKGAAKGDTPAGDWVVTIANLSRSSKGVQAVLSNHQLATFIAIAIICVSCYFEDSIFNFNTPTFLLETEPMMIAVEMTIVRIIRQGADDR